MGRAHEVRKAAMEKTAKAKAKLYSKYGKEIYLVAKSGGPEPDGNLALRSLIDKAKRAQVPSDVIKRAIDKVKSGVAENYETLKFEGFGPGDSTVIVECLTDNVNRTLSQVRPAFTKSKAKLGAAGSVAYLYDTLAIVVFEGLDEEATLNALIEADVDVQDLQTLENGQIKIVGEPTDLTKIKEAITAVLPNVEFIEDDITTIPQSWTTLEGEQMELFERLMNLLDDCDDVDTVYHNVSNYDDGSEEE
ncbi:putative transcriptional regulatory protein YeeN [Clostridiales bacterium CHKCI006]|uniref:Probable transcriptional regulatory protein IAD15_07620 n=1 Tax=Candidatus Fimiplasma intestinipullorum TaxID=2840825 RepID=A0A9D1HR09_9FIRM|nr:putative transcriptional regulatory protein YeeN [Clostridiales bacterium CHKCI006]HIU13919.1 YebC/PmpR family DNA-binding transcriptional regulator [Candidatus Fimiplasma intestinipullorum]